VIDLLIQRRQGQLAVIRHRVPADRAAGAGDPRRVVPLAEQPPVRGLHVVQLRRELVLRRQPVADDQRARAGRLRQMPDGLALQPHRGHHRTAGVAVQQDVLRRAAGRDYPQRGHPVRRRLPVGDVLRLGHQLMQPLGDVPPERETAGQREPAGQVGVEVRHLREFRAAHGTAPSRGVVL
jgi:hypothetical protein